MYDISYDKFGHELLKYFFDLSIKKVLKLDRLDNNMVH